jgi:hypothetical protein
MVLKELRRICRVGKNNLLLNLSERYRTEKSMGFEQSKKNGITEPKYGSFELERLDSE